MINNTIQQLASKLGDKLMQTNSLVATAESCTGGGVAYAITYVTGSSQWFDRSFITYSNESKQEMLGVQGKTLKENGAVSEAVVVEMAQGAVRNSNANIAVSISGIAGPGGGSIDKPVGTVCFSWCHEMSRSITETKCFKGSREEVREQAVIHALQGLIRLLDLINSLNKT
jgi:nicotinamide-nucleotide amidase